MYETSGNTMLSIWICAIAKAQIVENESFITVQERPHTEVEYGIPVKKENGRNSRRSG